MKEYSGTWDGTGDFELKFTGDIYIHSLALAENAFEDLYTKLSSEIKQTAESIRLEVKELSESNNQRFSQIEQRADSIELSVTKIEEDVTQLGLDINGVTDELKLYVKKDGLGSEINVALDNISVVSKNIYFTGNISANGNVSIQADGTIKAIGGYFEGEINANSGVFKNVRTPNNSLVVDENGNVSIVGKISTASSGTKIEIDPNSNSLKFYNSKGYDVGGISFLDSGAGGTSVTYPRLKLDNIASDGNLTGSTTLFAGSLSMISNLSGSRYQVSLGIDGLSFYKDGRLTKSYPSS